MALRRKGRRARRFALVPPNLDAFMTVRKTVGHEPEWLRQRFVFVPANLLGGSNLFAAFSYGTLGSRGRNAEVARVNRLTNTQGEPLV